MTVPGFDKSCWVELLREVGLDDAAMHRWHAAFERRYPDAHESFLWWLGVARTDIDRIRAASRTDWA